MKNKFEQTKIFQVKVGSHLAIGKHKMKVNRHSRDNWGSKANFIKMVEQGENVTVWGTIEIQGIPHCACALLNSDTLKVDLEIYKELDPGYAFIGGEGYMLDVRSGKPEKADKQLRNNPNPFAYHKNFKY